MNTNFASSHSVTRDDFPEIRWTGHWIWVPEEKIEPGNFFGGDARLHPESHGLFRKTFELSSVPARAPARISADSRYVLFVNGQEVRRGPIRSQPRRMHYDLFDLAPYLRAGVNTLAVYVKYFGKATAGWMPAVANGTLGKSGVLVFEANLGERWLVSDGSWRARKSDAWTADGSDGEAGNQVTGGIPTECFDARKHTPGWHGAGFDDSAWGLAQVIIAAHFGGRGRSQPPTDPYGVMLPSPLPALTGEVFQPVTIRIEQVAQTLDTTRNEPGWRAERSALTHRASNPKDIALPAAMHVPEIGYMRIMIDMGRIVAGFVQFTIRAPAGTVFDMGYVEEPINMPSLFGIHAGSRYIARGAGDSHAVFDPKGFRYAYVLVHGSAGAVTLDAFSVREHLYPWSPGAAFECSDADLNRIYAAGVRTVSLNSWDSFIDCPTREQRSWVGDAVVHQMVHLATNTDWRLAWHYLNLANSPRSDGILPMSVSGDVEFHGGTGLPDWSLHWIHAVHNLYRYAGERERVKELMPNMERVLRWYAAYLTSDGVLQDVVEWNLVDWSSLFSSDRSSIVNALWARGLHEFAEMAAWLGERASQQWAEALRAKVAASFEMFWDEVRGTYVDFIKDGAQQRPINQLAGALAIVSRLAPESRWRRIVDTITDPAKLVVRSWVQPPKGTVPLDEMAQRGAQMMFGGHTADWDVDKQIVSAEPFMSYVVHDAVAQAGATDKLPGLCKRWLEFLVDGYDTLGENWGAGTHVHGWSSTPSRDLVFYTLGVTPAEPGFTLARVAPQLGELAWAKGSVPTPHGLIHVNVTHERIRIDSPVPVLLSLPGRELRLAAGVHSI